MCVVALAHLFELLKIPKSQTCISASCDMRHTTVLFLLLKRKPYMTWYVHVQ